MKLAIKLFLSILLLVGCGGVEADNVDASSNDNGLALSYT